MNDYILMIAALVCPFISAFGASALTNHRLSRLEKKVDEHNGFDSRIAKIEEVVKSAHKRIDRVELERQAEHGKS
jgi:hypothetical protein